MKKSASEKNYSANTAPPSAISLTVPGDCAGLRLDQALAGLLHQFSRTRLTAWIREARVTVNGGPAQPRDKVWGGEAITVQPATDPQSLAFAPEPIPLEIVFEDDTLLVVDKPAGLVVHPGSGNWQGTLLNALLQHAPSLAGIPRAGIVHRLDKETSGLLVVAKTLVAQTALVRQLQARTVTREYAAIAQGRIALSGTVQAPIGRHPVHRTRMAVVARGKGAVTHYEVLERYANATLLRCRLETGRTHQIRVHLASIGHPLLGDPVYGARSQGTIPFHRQALHATRLSLVHPVSGKTIEWHSPLPADMEQLIATLRART
ncbi:MAG TPA: 23S rRNA pseudouridine(1911/1915/1917) synthase RluD [Burkholderiales bacterium]|nr:23S rRNA pseudouridine(1911/1915/1917) synthase RluD [Burkholderiales bacterium]